MTKNPTIQSHTAPRPPIVAVMGHIDHGKSTLLDYIRKTAVVEEEAGGITQRISAYEVARKDETGEEKKITFLDTPGHEAFSRMRERGAAVADIAILVVSAEDGVKPQTVEAWQTIEQSGTPAIVAINKIDKEGANPEKTKAELAEAGIFLENYGGKIPFALISAKTGSGVDELLLLVNLMAEMENFTGDLSRPASGFVLEANLDPKRGIQATLIVKDGVLKKGDTVLAGGAIAGTRIIEDFRGRAIKQAPPSSPVRVVGFNKMPGAGDIFTAFADKDSAISEAQNFSQASAQNSLSQDAAAPHKKPIPVVLKADSAGSLEALERAIGKIESESAQFKIIVRGVGPITEGDIKYLEDGQDAIVAGFNVGADAIARDLALRKGVEIARFDIIYKMTEWLESEMERLRPRIESVEISGKVKILKTFSKTKERQILGGKVMEGKIALKDTVKILRRDFEVGRGRVVNLEKNKVKISEVDAGTEFGMAIETKIEIVPGDILEALQTIKR